jgi:hypothetical protein
VFTVDNFNFSDSDSRWYEVPKYFQSDWVNKDALEYPSIFGGDYKFCYMGGSGTWFVHAQFMFNFLDLAPAFIQTSSIHTVGPRIFVAKSFGTCCPKVLN